MENAEIQLGMSIQEFESHFKTATASAVGTATTDDESNCAEKADAGLGV